MRTSNNLRNNSVRRPALLLAVAVALMVCTGCVTTQSQVRSQPSCSDCACEKCASALAAAQGHGQPADTSPESMLPAQVDYDLPKEFEDSPAEPRPVPPLPVPPESAPESLPARALTMPQAPVRDLEARQECAQLKEQTETLSAQLQKLESHLQQEQMKQQALRNSLVSVNAKVGTLSGELQYWKQEVQRIDAEAEQQHRQDLQSLQTISELISRLPRPATAAGEETSRQ